MWTADGTRVTFASTRENSAAANLYWQRADGSGTPERLTRSANRQMPGSWHASEMILAFEELNPQTSADVMVLPIERDGAAGLKPGTPWAFLNSPFDEREPSFSPDGKWLAYVSKRIGTG